VAIESSLRASLKLQQFVVHYQPIIDIHTRRVAGLEPCCAGSTDAGILAAERFIGGQGKPGSSFRSGSSYSTR
jgi:EAL domain-containing protein (putative c-di-GMP-specific phosphodiesterase class I)